MISRKVLLVFLLLACSTEVASQPKCTNCTSMAAECPSCRQMGQAALITIPHIYTYTPPGCSKDLVGSAKCNSETQCYITAVCSAPPGDNNGQETTRLQATSPANSVSDDLKTDLSQNAPVTQDTTVATTTASTTDPQPPPMRVTTTATTDAERTEVVLTLATGSRLEISTTTEVATLPSASVAESTKPPAAPSTEIGAGITTVSLTVVDAQLIGAIVGGILGFLLLLAIVVAVAMAVARSRRRARAEVPDSGIVAKPSMQTYSQPISHYASAPPEVNYDSASSALHF